MEKEKSHVLITHRNCPDGAAAAVIIKRLYPAAHIRFATHESIGKEAMKCMDLLKSGDSMFIADIAPGFKVLKDLMILAREKKVMFYLYDHHVTMKWLNEIESQEYPSVEIVFDETRCGSKILYDSIKERLSSGSHADEAALEDLGLYEDFIRVSNDRDLWLQKEEKSDELAMLHGILGDEGYFQRFLNNPSIDFSEQERVIMSFVREQKKKNEDKLLKSMRIAYDRQLFKYGTIYGEAQSSDLLNRAIEEHSLEYAFLINLNTKKVSMRSRGKMDCANFAEHYNGGGHVRASGFRLDFREPVL